MTRKLRLTLASILAVAALGAIAPAANAYVYWSNSSSGSIGRANDDGTGTASRYDRQFLSSDSRTGHVPNWSCWQPACPRIIPSSVDYETCLVSGGPCHRTVTLHADQPYYTLHPPTPVTIPVNGIVLIDDVADEFRVTGGTCVGLTSLPTAANCGITVAFNPRSVGSKSATLRVDTNKGARSVTLTGIGTAPAGSLSPSYSAFGSRLVSAGLSSAATFTLVSNGNHGLTIPEDGINLTGADPDQFQVTGGTCSAASTSLAQYQSCTVTVAFDPSSTGSKVAALEIQTNDGTKTATITGTGTATAEPTISGVGKPTKTSLKVKVGCGDENACTVRLTGKKVGTNAAITPETVFVPAGQQPSVTLAYSRALKTAVARGGRVSVTVTNPVSGAAKSIVVQVAR